MKLFGSMTARRIHHQQTSSIRNIKGNCSRKKNIPGRNLDRGIKSDGNAEMLINIKDILNHINVKEQNILKFGYTNPQIFTIL